MDIVHFQGIKMKEIQITKTISIDLIAPEKTIFIHFKNSNNEWDILSFNFDEAQELATQITLAITNHNLEEYKKDFKYEGSSL